MKPLKTFGLAITGVLIALVAVPATAQVNYAISDGAAHVARSPNASGDIVIASTYNGYPVTRIGFGAFYGSSVTSVTIPNSVTTIEGYAFFLCPRLASATIPDSVTTIGSYNFSHCTSLTSCSVDAINSVYSSLDGVLFDKAQTTLIQFPGGRGGSYVIPDSVTTIGSYAFEYCTGLTNVTIGNSVNTIEYAAFNNCTSLTNVTIPNSVTTIGGSAFTWCTSLASVTISNSVTTIEGFAFSSCTNLTNVMLGSGVTSIGGQAFRDCINLTSLAIPDSVTTIGDTAFMNCTSLANVMLGSSVTNIGNSAFRDCTRLTSVTIGNSVNTIGLETFGGCTSLTNFTFLGNAPLLFGGLVFSSVGPGATVYYCYGTTGWESLYGGLPTVMLGAPAPQVGAGTAGVKPGGFGFTITGVVNQTIVVEASTNLVTWQPIRTNTLSAVSTNFVDPQWLNHPRRFYRMRSN